MKTFILTFLLLLMASPVLAQDKCEDLAVYVCSMCSTSNTGCREFSTLTMRQKTETEHDARETGNECYQMQSWIEGMQERLDEDQLCARIDFATQDAQF